MGKTTEQTDIGLDIAFLEGRLRLTADAYNKDTRDLLNTVQLPTSTGYSQTVKNIGQIRNRGLEFSVDATIFNGEIQMGRKCQHRI